MRTSLYFLVAIFLCVSGAMVNWIGAQLAAAQEGDPTGITIADLQQQLESGLKARRPEEFAFIDRVVERVEQRKLSVGMVKSVFQWAVRKNKKIPFPHFERAIRIIADREGVDI